MKHIYLKCQANVVFQVEIICTKTIALPYQNCMIDGEFVKTLKNIKKTDQPGFLSHAIVPP